MSTFISFVILTVLILKSHCTTFTFTNKCDTTIWPGILTNAGSAPLNPTGFELEPGQTQSFQAPTGWSGRLWARTGCSTDSNGSWLCRTGDCGSGQVECNGLGAAPPATLAEFTLAGPSSGLDFYDVSLVDGYNLPMIVESSSSACSSTGCSVDLNQRCPSELRTSNGDACKSACEAFGKPEYCCNGEFGSPTTCQPTFYSEMFKMACPKSYSYAYDDATSTFTCTGGDYTVTFCPESTPSKKATTTDSSINYTPPEVTTEGGSGGDSGGSGGSGGGFALDSWIADLAIGHAPPSILIRSLFQHATLFILGTILPCILFNFHVL
nr:thaumatin-like protein [Allium sativum]UPH74558.1 thaumatin-like protein [Allium sativum]